MTLILTSCLSGAIVQVSDRRLTWPDGKLVDDDATKGVCVACQDAHFAIGYTGLAEIGATGTDHWLTNLLATSDVGSKTVIEVARVIGISARSDLATWPLALA